ncbi:barstar family protein [Kineococcus endophyticus]|uniref:Barstar family protein n=1 Tax=Kineococcus endophyticus TaxID=1181883 RepID=A0ABV3P3M5_9ACTN
MDFPGSYGADLDALSDCLSDVVTYDHGASESDTGLVLSFTGYAVFRRALARSRAGRAGRRRGPDPAFRSR